MRASLPLGVDFADPAALRGRHRPGPVGADPTPCSRPTAIRSPAPCSASARGTQRAAPIGPLRQLRDASSDRPRRRVLRLRDHLAATLDQRGQRTVIRSRAGEFPLAEEHVAAVKALLANGDGPRRRPGSGTGPAAGAGRPGRGGVSGPPPAFRCAAAARERSRSDRRFGAAGPRAGCCSSIPVRGRSTPSPAPACGPSIAGAAAQPSAEMGGARILLVRRPGRADPRGRTPLDGDRSRLRDGQRAVDRRPEPAAGVPGPDPARGVAGAGRTRPIILVCTHGVHDACCAIRGRPVAAALAARWPDLVWECSHVGGDRFAPNVVLLPDGLLLRQPRSRVGGAHRRRLPGRHGGHRAGLRGLASSRRPSRPRSSRRTSASDRSLREQCAVRRSVQHGPHHGHGSETTVDLLHRRPSRSDPSPGAAPYAARRPSSPAGPAERLRPPSTRCCPSPSCRRPTLLLQRDAEDLVVVAARVGPAVGVAGGHPERSVRRDRHAADPAVVAGEVRLGPCRRRRRAAAPRTGTGRAGRR